MRFFLTFLFILLSGTLSHAATYGLSVSGQTQQVMLTGYDPMGDARRFTYGSGELSNPELDDALFWLTDFFRATSGSATFEPLQQTSQGFLIDRYQNCTGLLIPLCWGSANRIDPVTGVGFSGDTPASFHFDPAGFRYYDDSWTGWMSGGVWYTGGLERIEGVFTAFEIAELPHAPLPLSLPLAATGFCALWAVGRRCRPTA